MMTKEAFQELLRPILDVLATMDSADADARAALDERFPLDSALVQDIAQAFAQGVEAGWLCDRQGGAGISYSRVLKAADSDALSVDAVRMSGPGPGHTHPNGEFDLCLAVDGAPAFDGNPPGWTVYPPGSWHVPTVRGGTMNILYFLPGGAIHFGPRPE